MHIYNFRGIFTVLNVIIIINVSNVITVQIVDDELQDN